MMTSRFKLAAAVMGVAATMLVPAEANVPVASANSASIFGQEHRIAGLLESRLAEIAGQSQGRIGVAAADLDRGTMVAINGDTPFPMASTAKIAIAATYLEGVDRGRFRLDQTFPLMVPVPSKRGSGATAPVRPGRELSARSLIDLMIMRSDNQATDAILAAVGGPQVVNAWLRRAGIEGQRLDHDMATLVRDDGLVDPVRVIDKRTSSTPHAMLSLLTALDRGDLLSAASRRVLFGAMERCVTGSNRIRGMLPPGTQVAHKTGTLFRASSDVGFIRLPDGRRIALVVFVTGPEGRPALNNQIAKIARVVYDNLY